MGTKYRLSVKTAVLAAMVFLLAGCAQFQQWEDSLQQPREWDGCAIGGALLERERTVSRIARKYSRALGGSLANRNQMEEVNGH